MANKTRLEIAKQDIVKALSSESPVFRVKDISLFFKENRDFWRLAQSTSLRQFISFLLNKTELKEVRFSFPHREVVGYTWGKVDLMLVLMKLIENSFYSHYTALRMRGLTEQTPKTIYISTEKKHIVANQQTLTQEAINSVFQNPPRATQNIIDLPDEHSRIAFLQSACHEGVGVEDFVLFNGHIEGVSIRCTNLERTMIDIAIRPFYPGGVAEVAKAFENAKDSLKVNKMSAMLKKMKFLYPYHQVIGYYLDRAGYKSTLVDIFRDQPMNYDFYLTYGMGHTTYCKEWRLFIPNGF